MINLFVWSGPRNISTALMRSFENRKDTKVYDEPFYAYYLKKTNLNHPMKDEIINHYHTNEDEVINLITKEDNKYKICLLYTSPSPRDVRSSRMPSSA